MTLPDWLTAVKERLARATKGPWTYRKGDSFCAYPSVQVGGQDILVFDHQGHTEGELCKCVPEYPGTDADASLIAHAPDDLQRAIEEIERLQAQVRVAEAVCAVAQYVIEEDRHAKSPLPTSQFWEHLTNLRVALTAWQQMRGTEEG